MKTSEMSDSEKAALKFLNETTHHESQFSFLKEHRSWRPESIHTFLGEAGAGKSTLVRSLILDFLLSAKTNDKLVLILSEETRFEFLTEYNRIGSNMNLDKLIIISEMELINKLKEPRKAWLELLNQLNILKPTLIFYDNITTSNFYSNLNVNDQGKVILKIANLCKTKIQCPWVLFAHTSSGSAGFGKRLIEMNDIRGNKTIANVSQFFYIMQRFQVNESFYPTIRILKHRGQEIDSSIFFLTYVKKHRVFAKDHSITFREFKEQFKLRNQL